MKRIRGMSMNNVYFKRALIIFNIFFWLFLWAIRGNATVNIETTRVAYTCNGVITSYAYPFKVLADADLLVVKKAASTSAETTLTLNTDYTVTGAGSSAGTVVLTAGSKCGSGYTLTILRNMAATQGTDYVDGEAFSAESIENALDKVTLIQQQQREEIGRAPKLPKTSTITDISLPNPTANNYIGWNAGATGLANLTGPVITTATQYEVDALISYGGGASYTQATIEAALTAIGTTNKVTLLLRPGTWVISSNADWSAYTNVTWKVAPGAILQIATGTTTTIYGKLVDGRHQMIAHVGTGIARFGPGAIERFRPEMWGAKGDGTTNDGPAINAMFDSARASASLGCGPWVEFLNGQMKTTVSINAGGFGNNYIKITGNGNYTNNNINGVMSGGVVLDLTGNEQGEVYGLNIKGDATTSPAIGILVSSAVISGGIRGGNMHIHENIINGTFTVAAYYQYGTDLNNFWNNKVGTAGTGVAIAISTLASPTLPVSSAYYTLNVSGGGLTTHRQGHNVISLNGTGRAFQFIEGLSSVYSSYGDTYQFTGVAHGPFMEIIKSGASYNIHDVRSEGMSDVAFIKTDGLQNSTITGTVQVSAPCATPLIDVSAAYGNGGGNVSGSYIRLAPSGDVTHYLFKTTGDGGLRANIIQLSNKQCILVNGTRNTTGNFIINGSSGTVVLNDGNTDDDGNIILTTTGGLQLNGGTGGGTGVSWKNHLSGTVSWNPGTVNAGVTTTTDVTVTGAAVGDPVTVGLTTLDEAGWMFSGQVRTANIVTVTLTNTTGGNITVPNGGTLRASVMKY